MPFGVKTDVGSMYKMGKSATENIGPFSYPPMTALGKQLLSRCGNPVTFKWGNAPKFGRKVKSDEPGRIFKRESCVLTKNEHNVTLCSHIVLETVFVLREHAGFVRPHYVVARETTKQC